MRSPSCALHLIPVRLCHPFFLRFWQHDLDRDTGGGAQGPGAKFCQGARCVGERLGEKFASPPGPGATRRPVPCVQPIRPVTIDKPEGTMQYACCATGLGRSEVSGGQRRSTDPHQPPKLLLPGVGQILAADGLGIGCAGDDFLDCCQWVVVRGQPPQVDRAADARAVAVCGTAPGVLGGR